MFVEGKIYACWGEGIYVGKDRSEAADRAGCCSLSVFHVRVFILNNFIIIIIPLFFI